MAKKPKRSFNVGFDMKYSHDVRVEATTKTEARKKAFKKFEKTRNKISEFNVYVDEDMRT